MEYICDLYKTSFFYEINTESFSIKLTITNNCPSWWRRLYSAENPRHKITIELYPINKGKKSKKYYPPRQQNPPKKHKKRFNKF